MSLIGAEKEEELNDTVNAMIYIKESAESVGFEVTENTAFDITFIAKIMRRLRDAEGNRSARKIERGKIK